MGRRKVEIKRIENKSNRQITFCKRRNGLMEKTRQLSILCGSSVAISIVSATGKLYSFSSGDSMDKLRNHYEIEHADELKTLDLAEKTKNHLSYTDWLEIVQCKLEEAKSDNVSVDSLISIEEQLKTALSITRARKADLMMDLVKTFQDKEKLSEQKNQVLTSQMEKMKKLLETENETAMSPENNSGYNPPETLPLLK